MAVTEGVLSKQMAQGYVSSVVDTLTIDVTTDLAAVEAAWRQLEAHGAGSPFQRFDFVRAWLNAFGSLEKAEPLIVTGRRQGYLRFILPLVVLKNGPFRTATFAGGPHANFNFGMFEKGTWSELTAEDVARIYKAISDKRPDIGLIHLTGQPTIIDGRDNPFVGANSRPAPHHSYDLSLDGGFDAVLSRHRGKKKRKKNRAQGRDFEAVGGYRFLQAKTSDEAKAILSAFFEQKAIRFAEMGIPNVFACPKTRGFFFELADLSYQGNGQIIDCYAVEAAGKIRATSIGAPFDRLQYYVMNSFASDEFARTSPGEISVFHFIESCCAQGFDRFNFGIGDARYKRSWSDRELEHAETLVPLNMQGVIHAALIRSQRALRDFIVARPALFKMAQKLRRRAATHDDGHGDGE